MKTNDGFEITRGMTVYDIWGEARIITALNPLSIYHKQSDDKSFTHHTRPEVVYGSQKNALNRNLEYITRKAWELEKEARGLREQEIEARLKIIELEKQEEIARQSEEIAEIIPPEE